MNRWLPLAALGMLGVLLLARGRRRPVPLATEVRHIRQPWPLSPHILDVPTVHGTLNHPLFVPDLEHARFLGLFLIRQARGDYRIAGRA